MHFPTQSSSDCSALEHASWLSSEEQAGRAVKPRSGLLGLGLDCFGLRNSLSNWGTVMLCHSRSACMLQCEKAQLSIVDDAAFGRGASLADALLCL